MATKARCLEAAQPTLAGPPLAQHVCACECAGCRARLWAVWEVS